MVNDPNQSPWHRLGSWITGLLLMGINLWCIAADLHHWYLYNLSDILICFQEPEWEMFYSSNLAVLGILTGLAIIMRRIKTSHGLILVVLIWDFGWLRILLIYEALIRLDLLGLG